MSDFSEMAIKHSCEMTALPLSDVMDILAKIIVFTSTFKIKLLIMQMGEI